MRPPKTVFLVLLAWAACLTMQGQNVGEAVCSLLDEEGFRWYGGKGTGLCRFDGYETAAFRSDRQHPDLLRSNDVLCMTEQRARAEIWFGTKEGAYILRKSDYTVHPIVVKAREGNELADKRVSCMLSAADGSVWLSYRNQLFHLSAKAEVMERFAMTWEGKNRSVMQLCFDSDSSLWVGLWNGGVIRLKKILGQWSMVNGQWSDYPTSPTTHLPNDQTTKHMLDSVARSLAPANDTTVLSWARIPFRQGENGRESFYIGTYHALYHYDGQQMRLLQGDLDKVRSMAYSEPSHTLYLLSRARGICQWKEGRLTTLSDDKRFRQLQLQGDTALLLSEGINGVSMLNLRTLRLMKDTTTANVKPVVTACVVNGEKQLMTYGNQVFSLPSNIDYVEVHLSTLDFEHAQQVQFAYRLDNDDEWTEMPEGEHVVKFSHLPAGNNRLQVRATDNFGRWSAPATVLTLARPALWYEHTWLWVIAAVMVIVGVITSIHPSEGSHDSSEALLPVADQEFLDKAAAAVSTHMIDSDYSVDALASDLCMSRANLHRKMRAITGQTPTEYIRNQRLERAAHLLRTTSHSVNEIADLVGFSYASYFTKCFKEKYGVLPKDYVK